MFETTSNLLAIVAFHCIIVAMVIGYLEEPKDMLPMAGYGTFLFVAAGIV